MKRILSITGVFALAILFTSAISIRETPQDPPRGKKEKKHIKIVKVGDDGKKVEIDTVIEGHNVFVFEGDTIGGHKGMKWVSDEDFDFDMDMDMDFEVKESGNVIIMKSVKDGKTMVREIKIDGNCEDVDMMKWHSKSGNNVFFGAPHAAHAPKIIRIEKHGGNVIDLSDPGIISFVKKDLKDGKEKITIVREKPSEKEIEVHEEIIMHGSGVHPMFIHEGQPHKVKQIKVIAGDDGHVEIIEDGKVMEFKSEGENGTFITDDGKKVIIKRIKEGNEMKVNVEVKEEIHEEKEHE